MNAFGRLLGSASKVVLVTVLLGAIWPVTSVAQQKDSEAALKDIENHLAAQKAQIEQLQQHVLQQGNWIGQLLYRSEDESNRRKQETEAKLLAPEFSDKELSLLDRWEINTESLKDVPKAVEFPTAPSPSMARPNEMPKGDPWSVYVTGDLKTPPIGMSRNQLRQEEKLPKPQLQLTKTDTQYPSVLIANMPKPQANQHVSAYFEFDTRDTFDGPQLWRYPNLVPFNTQFNFDKRDLTSARGVNLSIFQTALSDYRPTKEATFPFRVTAMSYPIPQGGGSLTDLVRTAQLLQLELSKKDSIKEVFNYFRHKYLWGGNDLEINALDTFRVGIAGCGHINELMGAMLEVNDIRTRAVSGFHPLFRVWNPGGGHTAAEVHDGERWSFIDSFLGVYFPGVSAADFEKSQLGKLPTSLVNTAEKRDPNGILAKTIGDELSYRELFRYRQYADKSMRLPVGHMLRLRGAQARLEPYPTEATYGLSWPLRKTDVHFDPEEHLPETTTIHVRARYVISSCKIGPAWQKPCVDPAATASPWATTSFTIRPRDLLTADKPRPASARASTPQ